MNCAARHILRLAVRWQQRDAASPPTLFGRLRRAAIGRRKTRFGQQVGVHLKPLIEEN